jgi:hypothetical protein
MSAAGQNNNHLQMHAMKHQQALSQHLSPIGQTAANNYTSKTGTNM